MGTKYAGVRGEFCISFSEESTMKRLSLLAVLLLVACSSGNPPNASSAASAEKSAQPAHIAVGVIPAAVLHDAQRNRDVTLSIQYPISGGPYPLIIFSHGYGSSEQGYEQLVSYWTTRGYAVIRPRHADAGKGVDAMRAIFGERTSQERERRRRPTKEEMEKAAAERQERERRARAVEWESQREPQWTDRVRDVTLIIDGLDGLEQRFPELKGKFDHAKVGVAGHSLGALTAMLAAGATTSGNPPLTLGDPRVKAIVAMSAPGVTASLGLNAQSFAGIRVPAMFMSGSDDRGAAPNEDAAWRKTAFTNAAAGDKYFVLLQGAGHMTFAGTYIPAEIPQTTSIPTPQGNPYPPGDPRNPTPYYPTYEPARMSSGPIDPQLGRGAFQEIRMISTAFWDVYLKGESKARDLLDKSPGTGGVTIEKR
jgi:predicted dienelactone hydrolase